jgi:SAM-dependent methyltransferase
MQQLPWRIARDVVRDALANAVMAIPRVRAWRLGRPRAGERFTGATKSLDRYAFQAVRGIEDVIGPIAGREIIEYGPGDTLSAGLALLAAGATTYTSLDRFVPDYCAPDAKTWYRGIRAGWGAAFPGRTWPDDLDPDRFPEGYADRVTILRDSIESVRGSERFDVVTSWQVGEHVLDIASFAQQTARHLRPDGVAVHRVDFGPHSWGGYDDPLLFLRFPAALWRAMGSNRGVPNRVRHHEFMQAWADAGLDVECRDMNHFRSSEIAFEKLGRRFRAMPRESLLVRDVVYVCRRPASARA